MGSAAVAALFGSAVREAGMAPQAVEVFLAIGLCLSRSKGVSSNHGGNLRGAVTTWHGCSVPPCPCGAPRLWSLETKKVGVEPTLVVSQVDWMSQKLMVMPPLARQFALP